MFTKDFYDYLKNHTLIGIKGGINHTTFLPIWMVVVNGRVFARSWNKSERSWFTAFQSDGTGAIQYGDKTLQVKGKKLNVDDPIHSSISKAYIKKYNQPENLKYSEGISRPDYFDHTIEFFPI